MLNYYNVYYTGNGVRELCYGHFKFVWQVKTINSVSNKENQENYPYHQQYIRVTLDEKVSVLLNFISQYSSQNISGIYLRIILSTYLI